MNVDNFNWLLTLADKSVFLHYKMEIKVSFF